ncbi:LexA family transcriptional regulator [Streptococcus anginosus]|uniref:LexA family transcriptional regulator n=1 Tax=Streptococcus anginosus TaxID=1328 RepID=UPI001245B72E|nr:S24 family peptidase [Streptococcus anginosus]KAA9263525.1 helix-turn-helix domain-containing protein [Streptococcus anginosus]KAA9317814.1 helix-turn-helix domain-containing protein [Streptococcus anginosus]
MARGRGKATPQEKEAMDFVSTKIRQLLDENNLKQSHLADKLDIPRSSFNEYVRGNALPRPGNVQKIADYFGLLKSDIDPRFKTNKQINTSENDIDNSLISQINTKVTKLHKTRQKKVLNYADKQLEEQNTVENSKNTVNEPQIIYYTYNYYDHPVSAGTGQYLNDVQVEQIELPIDVDADFVVPIYGDSMEPEYHSGDYVFVKLSVELSDGNIGVFDYYGDAYIKELVINDSGAYLHSLNPKYDDILIDADSDFRIIGEVVDIYKP